MGVLVPPRQLSKPVRRLVGPSRAAEWHREE